MSRILDFYRGTGPDGAGRRIDAVWAFDFEALDRHHDFIQWIFPLDQPSRFNPSAPLLSEKDKTAFKASGDLQAAVLRSLDLMLDFYGFERTANGIRPGADFVARSRHWATPGNHNHLRLSRIVQSLALLGRVEESRMLRHACLDAARALGPDRISARTVEVWRSL